MSPSLRLIGARRGSPPLPARRGPHTDACCPRGHAVQPPARALLPGRPSALPSPARRPRSTAARGILDSYRSSTASTSDAAGAGGDGGGGDDDDDGAGACPIDCVCEVVGAEGDGLSAFDAALAAAGPDALVVVDFYKTACGACRYIAPGFVKLCKAAGKGDGGQGGGHEQQPPPLLPDVAFLKHNVLDEEGGRTELAVREGVRAVPTFHFYRGGVRLEAFPTRDRAVVAAAVNRLVGRQVL